MKTTPVAIAYITLGSLVELEDESYVVVDTHTKNADGLQLHVWSLQRHKLYGIYDTAIGAMCRKIALIQAGRAREK